MKPAGSLRLLAAAAVLLLALNMPVAQGQTTSAYSAYLTGLAPSVSLQTYTTTDLHMQLHKITLMWS